MLSVNDFCNNLVNSIVKYYQAYSMVVSNNITIKIIWSNKSEIKLKIVFITSYNLFYILQILRSQKIYNY